MRRDDGARGRSRRPAGFPFPWPFGSRRLSPAARGRWQIVRLLLRVSMALTVVALIGGLFVAALPLGFTLATGALVGAVPEAVRGGFSSPAGQLALRSLLLLSALFVAQRTVGPIRGALLAALGRDLDRYLDERLMLALQRPPGIGHLEDPAVQDQIKIAQGLGGSGYTAGSAAIALGNVLPIWLQSGAYAVVLAHFQPWLAAGYFAVQVLIAEVNQREYLRATQVVANQTQTLRRSDYFRDLALTAGAAKEVRLYAMADWLLGRYNSSWLESITAVWRERRQGHGRLRATAIAGALAQVVVLGALGRAGADGSITLTALTVFVGSVFGMQAIVTFGQDDFALAWGTASVPAIQAVEALTAERAAASLDDTAPAVGTTAGAHANGMVAAPGSATERAATASERGIRFHNVRFRYPGAAADTFAGLDLFIPEGRSLAVVGVNGAGKTTLVKLLCRFYEPQAGCITVYGSDMRRQDARAWQRQVAAIFQDFVKYPLSARENIHFGAPEQASDLAQLAEAARKAGALDIIEQLPRGWDTVLSRQYKDGADLSGGQWQRLALARALFAASAGARILVLDEPTANLDVRAEAALYDRFLEITAGLTTILISHRFSTVRRADSICVLEHGRVVEQGTHADLLDRGGQYAQMYTLQAARFAEEAGDA